MPNFSILVRLTLHFLAQEDNQIVYESIDIWDKEVKSFVKELGAPVSGDSIVTRGKPPC